MDTSHLGSTVPAILDDLWPHFLGGADGVYFQYGNVFSTVSFGFVSKSTEEINKILVFLYCDNSLADLEGACPAHAPLRVQILSFRHTNFSRHNRLGSPRPPMRFMPPMGNPGSATVICLIAEKLRFLILQLWISIPRHPKSWLHD